MLFAFELTFAGVFRVQNVPAETLQPLVMIECPRLLFPFAREIVANAVRNGGFPRSCSIPSISSRSISSVRQKCRRRSRLLPLLRLSARPAWFGPHPRARPAGPSFSQESFS